MYTEQIQDIFNFSMPIEDIEEGIFYQYSLEKQSSIKERLLDKTANKNDFKDTLFFILSDTASVLEWKSIKNINDIDNLIAKIDARIAQLEQEEMTQKNLEKEDRDICVNEPGRDDMLMLLDEKNSLKKYCPQPGFSNYYNLLYSVVYLYKYILQIESRDSGKLLIDSGDISYYIPPFFKLCTLIHRVIDFVSERDNKYSKKSDDLVKLSSDYLKSVCMKLFSDNNCNEQNRNYLLLAIQLNAFIQVILNPTLKKKVAIELAISTISLHCAELCYQNDDNDIGIKFSILALRVGNPQGRQNAFNLLGLCAIESNQYQLAYDTYFSWINMQMVDCMEFNTNFKKELLEELNIELQSDNEQMWRNGDQKSVAIMYGNFAYVCGSMYDLLKMSTLKRNLICIAKYYIKLAIKYDPESCSYFCSAGTIFADAQNYKEALAYYSQYYSKVENLTEKITALRSLLFVHKKNLDKNLDNNPHMDFENIADEFLQVYEQLLNDNNETVQSELTNARDLYFLLSECRRLSNKTKNLKYLLFQIDNVVKGILDSLRQESYVALNFNLHCELFAEKNRLIFDCENLNSNKQYIENKRDEKQIKEIAYYTTLSNLRYLFSEIQQESGNALNCLTMMHARYMNDPEEGLILLQKLKDYLPKSPENLRDELYDQKFVFLKSFTGLIDQLNMWTMYGSDKECGNDCNGCCVCIAPETFDIVIHTQNKSAAQLSSHSDDDFHLYSVAYMDGEKIFVNGARDSSLERQYKRLKELLSNLSKGLRGASDIDINNKYIQLSCSFT